MENKLTTFLFDGVGINKFQKFLDVTSLRHKLIAGNVANVATPGYKSRDINFQKELDKLSNNSSHLRGATTHAGHIPTGQHQQRAPKILSTRPGRNDLNSVDIDHEVPKMAQNELLYSVSARLLKSKFDSLRKVITSK